MDPEYRNHAGPSRRMHNPILPFDEDIHAASAEEPADQEKNDRKLRQAIAYLAAGGRTDTRTTYLNRVQEIDRGILQQYKDSGYFYNPSLYKRLQSKVRNLQDDLQHSAEEDSFDPLVENDISYEDRLSPEALMRQGETVEYPPERSGATLRASISSDARATSPFKGTDKDVNPREHSWQYGGPNNEVEEWHKDFPPFLPFGETLYMQEWESMKINYDLRESAKRKAGDPPLVDTDVPFEKVKEAGFTYKDIYDSGSRFKLPKVSEEDRELVSSVNLGRKMRLQKVVDDFNQGVGNAEERKEKDYAPRIFLEKMVVPEDQQDSSIKSKTQLKIWKPPIKEKRATGSGRVGMVSPDVHAILHRHPQRPVSQDIPDSRVQELNASKSGATPAPVTPQTTATPAPQRTSILSKKIEEARRTVATPTPQKPRAKDLARDPVEGAPIVRRLVRVEAGPSTARRRPGRPRMSTSPAPSTARPIEKAAAAKRKRVDTHSSTYQPAKRPQTAGRTEADKRPKKVAFASKDEIAVLVPPRVQKSATKTNATGVNKASKASQAGKLSKGKGKDKAMDGNDSDSNPLLAAEGYETVTRGITRSGTKFK